ncbi:uncharacterized protein MONOS_6048 [Monocercomonoides exilis]|uniref:uncharacterized protein n=1 Tax=Monocercomonoides exilis TaxID=2049356 RepID=UPI00355A88E5|nr:hypothetical protein MONOS_6048 [Monocercomonoides exilis]|eukprot:MONOS_6048.1-p1 / transcript=MONOS_6048.1 / gene=MONOS_6048 / organism=Monocercomonoides_exilis_PA203 / gene_product=unspecified product / transcript_product=unspecified product / location=Mono_scaffold00185:73020-73806(-) / protein_length=172 / sequence_SO=supercontig / SO=protein_coding / is_pseudo=false
MDEKDATTFEKVITGDEDGKGKEEEDEFDDEDALLFRGKALSAVIDRFCFAIYEFASLNGIDFSQVDNKLKRGRLTIYCAHCECDADNIDGESVYVEEIAEGCDGWFIEGEVMMFWDVIDVIDVTEEDEEEEVGLEREKEEMLERNEGEEFIRGGSGGREETEERTKKQNK